jgi:hypothetical protein
MAHRNYLTTASLSEIIRYDESSRNERDAVSFSGAVRKHPYDRTKFLLITNPGDENSHFYEFRVSDVVKAHDLKQVVGITGEAVQLVELRVRKGSHGIEMKPFEV